MTAEPLFVFGRPVRMRVGVLAWALRTTGPRQSDACRFLLPGDRLTFARFGDTPGTAVVKAADGGLWVVNADWLEALELERTPVGG